MAAEGAHACAGPWNGRSIGLMSIRRADLDPRLLPWTALVSADYLLKWLLICK